MREFFTLQCFSADALAIELNKLEKEGWNIFQVLSGAARLDGNCYYTIIYFKGIP